MISQRFFGHPESPLFAVYHQPRGRSKQSGDVRAAVICPSIGQEYNRTHWTLRLLANQVARRGVHVLRLDYHGIGDSAENIDQIDSLNVWRSDISPAIEHLKQKTNANSVMLIGQRFGAALASQIACQRLDVNGVVLWEPVTDGKAYLDTLRQMHATMLDLWVCKMQTPNNESIEEIVGSQFQRSLIQEIEAFRLQLDQVVQPQLIIDTPQRHELYWHSEPGTQLLIEEARASSWHELEECESAWLRPETLRTVVNKVVEMFDRLQGFNALGPLTSTTLTQTMEATS